MWKKKTHCQILYETLNPVVGVFVTLMTWNAGQLFHVFVVAGTVLPFVHNASFEAPPALQYSAVKASLCILENVRR